MDKVWVHTNRKNKKNVCIKNTLARYTNQINCPWHFVVAKHSRLLFRQTLTQNKTKQHNILVKSKGNKAQSCSLYYICRRHISLFYCSENVKENPLTSISPKNAVKRVKVTKTCVDRCGEMYTHRVLATDTHKRIN